jgi:hypothetical protein
MDKKEKRKMVAEGLAGVAIAYLGGRQFWQGATKAWDNGGRQLTQGAIKYIAKIFH